MSHTPVEDKNEFMQVRATEGLWENLMWSEGTLELQTMAVIAACLRHMTRLLIKTRNRWVWSQGLYLAQFKC